ncbi:MAG: restriction endonuclease subunit S [Candidatus Thiodiazotropha endolucinida]|nr:restriction endonuclease subunit S [Candidatus Thiodiazotropha taylori]MCW4249206.1 restriction endonuclease subunit S [Candidatus Thiodiazotropha endolucinida]
MNSKWPIRRIDEIIDFNPSRTIVRGSVSPFVEMAAIDEWQRDITNIDTREYKGGGARFEDGDTLFARITPCLENGKAALVSGLDGDIAHGSTEFIVMSARDADYDERFTYYLTRLPEFRSYAESKMEGTSGRQRVSWQSLAEYAMPLPPQGVRKEIGDFLGALDDKIAVNRKSSGSLEAIARAIFRSWFVNFEPAKGDYSDLPSESAREAAYSLFPKEFEDSDLGKIPKGWKVATMEDLGSIKGGATPSTKNPDFWDGGIYHWITPKDMSGLRTKVVLDTARKITAEGVSKISSGQLPIGTVLMSSRAPVGYLAIASVPVSINQGFIAIVCNKAFPNSYVVHCLEQNMERIKANAGGSTFAEISKRNFKPIQIVQPPKKILEHFDEIVSPLHQRVVELEQENIVLAKTRDFLLPKLMSGEVSLEAAESAMT